VSQKEREVVGLFCGHSLSAKNLTCFTPTSTLTLTPFSVHRFLVSFCCGELNQAKTLITMAMFTFVGLFFVSLCVQISNGFLG
jgi:hypothetical protein